MLDGDRSWATDVLQKNAIAGAGLDVTDPEPLPHDYPLWRFESVTITPHNAGHSLEHGARLADIVGNVRRLDAGDDVSELENLVCAPN